MHKCSFQRQQIGLGTAGRSHVAFLIHAGGKQPKVDWCRFALWASLHAFGANPTPPPHGWVQVVMLEHCMNKCLLEILSRGLCTCAQSEKGEATSPINRFPRQAGDLHSNTAPSGTFSSSLIPFPYFPSSLSQLITCVSPGNRPC